MKPEKDTGVPVRLRTGTPAADYLEKESGSIDQTRFGGNGWTGLFQKNHCVQWENQLAICKSAGVATGSGISMTMGLAISACATGAQVMNPNINKDAASALALLIL